MDLACLDISETIAGSRTKVEVLMMMDLFRTVCFARGSEVKFHSLPFIIDT